MTSTKCFENPQGCHKFCLPLWPRQDQIISEQSDHLRYARASSHEAVLPAEREEDHETVPSVGEEVSGRGPAAAQWQQLKQSQ